jgi:Fic family protein
MKLITMRKTGTHQTLGAITYFIPAPLPPANPPLQLNTAIMSLYGEANFALGQLNEMGGRLPDFKRFIKAYVIKEALLSSAIEGIHTTLMDVLTYPLNPKGINKETQLVFNYTKALYVALNMLKDEGLPLVSRVILAAHKALLSEGDGDKSNPGAYRQQSVRIGQLVPPPAPKVLNLMRQLEQYMNEPSDLPILIRIGLAHVQFETIHPFLDGNGRIGRLLIVLMLIDNALLDLPILYPSYYFKKHHSEYYQKLDRVRTHGDFEGWITYYLKAIRDSAIDAHQRAKAIESLEIKLKTTIENSPDFFKIKETARLSLNFLLTQPVTDIPEMSQRLNKSYNTISHILKQFIKQGVVSEQTTHKRNRLYYFNAYLSLLEKEYH